MASPASTSTPMICAMRRTMRDTPPTVADEGHGFVVSAVDR
jgi:hypothetical protein